MQYAPIPINEKERLKSLKSLNILDTKPEERFDRITRLAIKIFSIPIATVTLVDANREWFKSCVGLPKKEGERAISFCGHAMLIDDILVIPDTTKDIRFSDNPMVIGEPYIRFYAGVPLTNADGQKIGTFCIKDHKQREFNEEDKQVLKSLASWAEVEINSHNLQLALKTREELSQKLKESEERWQFALEGSRNGVWDWNVQTNKVFFSKRWKEMLGYKEDEIKNDFAEWEKRVNSEDLEETNKNLQDHFKGKTPFYESEHRVLCKDGTYKWILDRGKVMSWLPNGKPLRMVGTHTDITHRKKIEQELALRTRALDFATVGVLITDPNLPGNPIIYANAGFEKITGYTKEEIIGKNCRFLQKDDKDQQEIYKIGEAIKNKKEVTAILKNYRKNGSMFYNELSVSPVFDEKGKLSNFIGIQRDVTYQKEIDKLKTDFISLVSHQLRTPLSAMKWFSEILLQGDVGELNSEQKEIVVNIDQSNNRMIELVNALLNISRIESGRIVIDPKQTDLKALLNDVKNDLTAKLIEKDQILQVKIDEGVPLINLDSKLIRQVYINLLTNAIKYSPKHSKISVFVVKKDSEVISQVQDSGYGIPEKEKDKVFEKFYRGENVVKLEMDGTGLGLYLVKMIIDLSLGKIWFKSKEGKGTAFWFSLPLSGMKKKEGEVNLIY